jgi:hypothetical protein
MEPGGGYAFNVSADGVEFARLMKEGFRIEQPVEGGRLRGTVALRSQGGEDADLAASGYVHVTDAALYELPAVVRMLNLLRLGPDDRTAFQEARVWFFVRGGRIVLEDIRLMGKALNLYGAGLVGKDGDLALTFMPGQRDDSPLVPALSELWEGLRKEVVTVEVTGTLAEPDVQLRTRSTLTAPLRDLVETVRESPRRER